MSDNPDREAHAWAEQLRRFDAATLHEAHDRRGALPGAIKPVAPEMVACGPAFTVWCPPGDNLMLQVAVAHAPRGSVLVLAVGGYAGCGVFGDMLATACHAKGLAGLVTDSAVRDARALRQLGFPVFSNGLCIQGAAKHYTGPLNRPVSFGAQIVNPGDMVFGDEDGVLVMPRAEVDQVLAAAERRVEMERQKVLAYRAGRSVIEVNKLAAVLEVKGWSAEKDIA